MKLKQIIDRVLPIILIVAIVVLTAFILIKPYGKKNQLDEAVTKETFQKTEPGKATESANKMGTGPQVSQENYEAVSSLNKVKPAAPYKEVPPLRSDEGPKERLAKYYLPPTPQEQKMRKLSRNAAPVAPINATKPYVVPAGPKPSPNPFTNPPITVDPRRVSKE